MTKKIISIICTICVLLGLFVMPASSMAATITDDDSVGELSTPSGIVCTSTVEGVKISWNKVGGAWGYRVFYLGAKGWTGMGNTQDTSFIDSDVKPGNSYTYTVRCVNSNGDFCSQYNKTGIKYKYYPTPYITECSDEWEQRVNGIKITWTAIPNAAKYRVYWWSNSRADWVRQCTIRGTTYIDNKGINDHEANVYTVRCVNEGESEFVSDYDRTGFSHTFNPTRCDVPTIESYKISSVGTTIYWNATQNASKYRVYAANSRSGSGTVLGETYRTSFTDAAVSSGKTKWYYVRVLDKNNNPISNESYRYEVKYSAKSRDAGIKDVDIKLVSNGSNIQVYKDASLKAEYFTVSCNSIAKGVNVTSKSICVNYSGYVGYVAKNNAFINVEQYCPSIIVALSYASNTPYPKDNSVLPKDSDSYNMFALDERRDVKGLSDTKYYSENVAWLQYETAWKLAGAQNSLLSNNNYCIKLYDAFRPRSVAQTTDTAWDKYLKGISQQMYNSYYGQIAPAQTPPYGSVHNYACAVDATLVDIKTGKELAMPTQIHNLSLKPSWNNQQYWKQSQNNNAQALKNAMTKNGFYTYYNEWWHYDLGSSASKRTENLNNGLYAISYNCGV